MSIINLPGDLVAAKRHLATTHLVDHAKTQVISAAADFRTKFMAEPAV